ncbi:hypothetical protein [Halobaculum sp. MBLA0143]|uniref:hypothetical protein n=1 Tax=Halobaculum sp. MBLA0143 TaxID=3079933 RepID=UPI003524A42A
MCYDGSSTRRTLLSWADDGPREFPWRDRSRSFYEVFLAEFLLTQTPAENVADVYPELCDRYPDLDSLARASESELESALEPLGFQRMRAAALSEVAATHDSLPRDGDELRELPRVGPYVADATRCFALAESVPIVDRNVVRVYERLSGEEFPTADAERRSFAAELLPSDGERARTYNLALLDFGATVCTKREPACPSCPLRERCEYVTHRER